MKLLKQDIRTESLDAVKPHPRNPRKGNVAAISESIAANGFYGAIVAQRSTGYILAGNHRWQAARKAGATEIPVAWIDVADDVALRILLADNRTNDVAGYDDAALAELLQEIVADAGSLQGTGYDSAALDALLEELGIGATAAEDPGAQMDRAAELREQWGTERGQVWAIPSKTVPGKSHRLMCGDSTSAEDVGRLMSGARAAAIATDPPYGDNYESPAWMTGRKKDIIANDAGFDFEDVIRGAFAQAADHLASPAFAWVFAYGGKKIHLALRVAELIAPSFSLNNVAVWDKADLGMGQILRNQWEALLLFSVGDRITDAWHGGNSIPNVFRESVGRPQAGDHPTPKPVPLFEQIVPAVARPGAIVLDMFAGSGTTAVAAERARRVAYGMELEPKYVAVILQRLTDMGLSPHRVTRDEA